MKNRFLLVSVFILAAVLFSCFSTPSNYNPGFLSAKTMKLVQNAVFEVVLEKPAEGKIVYDRELDWESVPYAIRSDKYDPIGTAFAISKTELITAFHVLEDMSPKKYFVRDMKGNVYEIDQITGGCNERDFIIFTVKEKTFNKFFKIEKNTKMGDLVFSIGNALGEGIVIRNGFILGTVPEDDSGRWEILKSSADINPGNSGGPLVTPSGKVVSLIHSHRGNIMYSVPADVILNYDRSFLTYRVKANYSHLILPEETIRKTFETQVPLPRTYTEAISSISEAYRQHYTASMTELFEEAPEYLTGPKNARLFNSSLSSSFPQYSYVDSDDGNWNLSDMDSSDYYLDDDGLIMHDYYYEHDYASRINFYKIERPLSVPLEKICTDPEYIMDLLLQNIRAERYLWDNDKYRILSYGPPSSAGQFRDTLGRTWITAHWFIGYNDQVLIMYILPLPNGPALITTMQDSGLLHEYEWDLQKLCEHIFTAYDATFTEWTDFMNLKEYIPDFFKDLRFEWDGKKQRFILDCDPYSLNIDKQVFDWDDDSELFLSPAWFMLDDKPVFGIQKIVLWRDVRGKESFRLSRNVKPDSRLSANTRENWNDRAMEKFPYNGTPVISVNDNTGSVGAIVKAQKPHSDIVFSLYLSMENPLNERNLSQRLNAIKQGLVIRE
ncbi:MAG: serine protease [Treponema sp.]|nr:serine protease [Treponema sp.]